MQLSWGAIAGGTVLILLGLYLSLFRELSGSIGDAFSTAIVSYADPRFLDWLRLVGILVAVRGGYLIVSSTAAPDTLIGRSLAVGDHALSLLSIPLLLWLREHTELIVTISIRDGEIRTAALSESAVQGVRNAIGVLIALILIGVFAGLLRLFLGQGSAGGTPPPA
jgi:hypothetical protein